MWCEFLSLRAETCYSTSLTAGETPFMRVSYSCWRLNYSKLGMEFVLFLKRLPLNGLSNPVCLEFPLFPRHVSAKRRFRPALVQEAF